MSLSQHASQATQVSVGGVSVHGWSLSGGGLCQGTPPRETPLYGNEQAVRILLECILVIVSTCVDLQMEAKLKLEKEKKKKKQRW